MINAGQRDGDGDGDRGLGAGAAGASDVVAEGGRLPMVDLGRMSYAAAFAEQERRHAEALERRERYELDDPACPLGTVLLVEHDPPVITVSRRPGASAHLLASAEALERMGVEVEATDRGGDITYHGPGQLVAYPIVDLNRVGIRLHEYMRLLEASVIDAVGAFGVAARRDPEATGVWVDDPGRPADPRGAKVCAVGVRVRRWATMHGLALNVTTALEHFKLIVPCGLAGRPVTSLERVLGERTPGMEGVKAALVGSLRGRLTGAFEAKRGAGADAG